MTGGRLAVLSALLAVLVAGCGGGSHKKQTVVGRDSAGGSRAAAEASVTVPAAKRLSVRVTARPKQPVSGSWAITCSANAIWALRDADDFSGRAPLVRPMRDVVFPPAHSCTVVADAKLSASGRVKVEILKEG